MTGHRRAAKRDDNEEPIVSVLRRVGCLVEIAAVKDGFPDLVVFSPFLKAIVLIEVKDGNKRASDRKLTEAQEQWHSAWQAAKAAGCVVIVKSIAEALKAVGAPAQVARMKVMVKS